MSTRVPQFARVGHPDSAWWVVRCNELVSSGPGSHGNAGIWLGHREGCSRLDLSSWSGHLDLPCRRSAGDLHLDFGGCIFVMVPFTPLKVTLIAPKRLVPLMVTTVSAGPLVGVNLMMVGAGVRQSAALVDSVLTV